MALGLALVGALAACGETHPPAAGAPDPLALLAQEGQGFARPDGPWQLRLPADHGAHPAFRSEAWSVAGSLTDAEGRRFGFRLVFLRLALMATPPERASAWAANQVVLAHFALTDGPGRISHAEDRASRAALGLSGADASPARVWLEDWSFAQDDDGRLRLTAAADGRSLSLALKPAKPPLKQGEIDLPGLAEDAPFRFYAISRLNAEGSLDLGGKPLAVSGSAWLDHAWGDVPLPRGQVALDRFALQLEDGRDLLCLRLHRRDGSGTPIPSCLLVAGDGTTQGFRRRDLRLESTGTWKSPLDGTPYPLSWQLALPAAGLELSLAPLVEAQERDGPLRAWSGAVTVAGRDRNGPVSGQGFVELTGYAGNPAD
jgi:predicted secreted hydrolase